LNELNKSEKYRFILLMGDNTETVSICCSHSLCSKVGQLISFELNTLEEAINQANAHIETYHCFEE